MASRADSAASGCRKLNIKYLENGWKDALDQDDSVGEIFVDRTSVNAQIEDWTVLVRRLPPDPGEHITSFREESIAPNSSARYLKRPRPSLLEDATTGRYANGYAHEGYGVTNKRQRLDYSGHGGTLDPDRPINSRERDLGGSVFLVEDSQQSPRASRRSYRCTNRERSAADIIPEPNMYAIPVSLSSPYSQALESPCQVSQTMTIPDSPPSRGALPNEDIPQPVSDHRAETPKSEPPEADNIVRSIPPSDPSTPHPPMVQQTEKPQGSFRKPRLPPPRTKSPVQQTPNAHRITQEMVTTHYTTPEGQEESLKSDGKLRRLTSAARGPHLPGSFGSNRFATRKVPRNNIWDDIDIESDEETHHGDPSLLSTKRPKQHHPFSSGFQSSEPGRESTGSREPSVDQSAIKYADRFLKQLTPGCVSEGGLVPRCLHRPEKHTQTYPETPLAKFQNGTQSEASRCTPIVGEHEKATEEDHSIEMEVDAGVQPTKTDDGRSTGERCTTWRISSGDSENSSQGRSVGSTMSTAIVLENQPTETKEEDGEDEDDKKAEDSDDEEKESQSEASEPEPPAKEIPARKTPAKKLPAKTQAEQSSTKIVKQIVSQKRPIDSGASEPENLQINGYKNSATLEAESPHFKTPSAETHKAATSSTNKSSSTALFPGKSALKSMANRSDSVSSRGTPSHVRWGRAQSHNSVSESSPSMVRRLGSRDDQEEKTSEAPSAVPEKPKTPPPLSKPRANRSKPKVPGGGRSEGQRMRDEIAELHRQRKSSMIQTELQPIRSKGKEAVRDPPVPQPTALSEKSPGVGKDAPKLETQALKSGNEPGPSRRQSNSTTEPAVGADIAKSKSPDVLDQASSKSENLKVNSRGSKVGMQEQPTARVNTPHSKSLSRSPARVVASSASSSSASETESETESESESENGEAKVDEEERPPSSTSQEAASGTSKDIGRSANPSASSSSESESDDGDLPPMKRTPPHGTDKSRSVSVGNEAERQLQREARESLEPSRSSQIKSAVKTPVAVRALAIINEGSLTTTAKQEARPANTRFPSLTSLRASSSSLPSSSNKWLPSYKMPLKGSSGQQSLGMQVKGGKNIDEASSDDDSSTSEDEDDEEVDDLGTSDRSAGTGSSQRRAGKGLGGLMKRTSCIAYHVSLLT